MDAENTQQAHPDPQLEHWLRLRHIPGLGNKTFTTLLEHFGHVDAIIHASHQQLSALSLPTEVISAILSLDENAQDDAVQADLRWSQQAGHHIITRQDPRYPRTLQVLDDAPAILYIRGDCDYLQQPQLAMVGSRNPTAAGRSTAREFARHLSDAGITITSGLAAGIDGASHEGALGGLAGTNAVVAHGLDIIYPAQHRALADDITRRGAIISEMPIGTEPSRGLFPRRNRLISALSLGTLVVEAAMRSGSLITARYALEQNREVFAIPGSIHNPMARGCHQLIRQGAKLVETADDILEELCNSLPQRASYPQKPTHSTQHNPLQNPKESAQTLDPDHQKLLKCLAYEPCSIDELVIRSNFSAAEVASMLLILELEGRVISQDGHYTKIS